MEAETGVGAAEISAAVFGNRHAALVLKTAAEVAEATGLLTTRRIASITGLADSLVRAVLLRFIAAGVLEAVPRMPNERAQYYMFSDSPLTRSVLATAADVIVTGADRRAPAP